MASRAAQPSMGLPSAPLLLMGCQRSLSPAALCSCNANLQLWLGLTPVYISWTILDITEASNA